MGNGIRAAALRGSIAQRRSLGPVNSASCWPSHWRCSQAGMIRAVRIRVSADRIRTHDRLPPNPPGLPILRNTTVCRSRRLSAAAAILEAPVSDRGGLEDVSQSRRSPLRSDCKLLILNGEMAEWSMAHAWKLIPAARADAHQKAPTHFRTSSSHTPTTFDVRR